jgi:hypothetical protein
VAAVGFAGIGKREMSAARAKLITEMLPAKVLDLAAVRDGGANAVEDDGAADRRSRAGLIADSEVDSDEPIHRILSWRQVWSARGLRRRCWELALGGQPAFRDELVAGRGGGADAVERDGAADLL